MKPSVRTRTALWALLAVFAFIKAISAADDFSALVGYKFISGLSYGYTHNTHPDDSFLPSANVPGSAGSTSLSTAHFGIAGVGYQPKLYGDLHLTLDVGLLFGGARDRHQNDNDLRPPAVGAFVYSQAGPLGAYFAPGLEYRWRSLAVGAEAQVAGIPISSGWDRFGSDQEVKSEFRWVITGGPKLGVRLSESMRLEGSVQFGKSIGASVGFRYFF
jgi:hypothetical protein